MATGLSLHIGLNAVNPDNYAGWSGPLTACEADAQDMELIAKAQGFSTSVLLTEDATRAAVLGAVASAAKALSVGDIFLMSISSHGGQVPDQNGDEPDGLDETWCLYDGQLIDDEVSLALAAFAEGVRILVISDSCHSGSVVRTTVMRALHGDMLDAQAARASRALQGVETQFDLLAPPSLVVPRVMPQEVMARVYLANKKFYDDIGKQPALRNVDHHVAASVILLSGCQDNQLSMDGAFNGAFTGQLKRTWNGGKYHGDYDSFISTIRTAMADPTQSPGIFRMGPANSAFDAQKPFEIA